MKLPPLSPEAQRARRPPSPEELVGALQDRVHIEPGRSRAQGRAAKRESRQLRGCFGKTAYQSQAAAELVRSSLSFGDELASYQCPRCERWHLGHREGR